MYGSANFTAFRAESATFSSIIRTPLPGVHVHLHVNDRLNYVAPKRRKIPHPALHARSCEIRVLSREIPVVGDSTVDHMYDRLLPNACIEQETLSCDKSVNRSVVPFVCV